MLDGGFANQDRSGPAHIPHPSAEISSSGSIGAWISLSPTPLTGNEHERNGWRWRWSTRA
jgi:hypothetical protein